MRTLEGDNRIRNGLMGIIILVLVIGVGQSFASVPMVFATPTYYAQFTDTGGLNPGDKVRIAGVDVGNVRSMEIEGDKVVIGYSLGGHQGRHRQPGQHPHRHDPRAQEPRDRAEGRSTTLKPNGVLPLGQTTTPYQIYDAFFDLTKAASGWDTDTVKQSLNVLSETIDQTYPHLSAALDGVARFSDTHRQARRRDQDAAGQRQQDRRRARQPQRADQLAARQRADAAGRRQRAHVRRQRAARAGRRLLRPGEGLHRRQPEPQPRARPSCDTISDVLVARKYDLIDVLTTLSKFTASLAEGIASGPYFKVMLVNLLPYWILQPWVDAAFKKRGISPEEFWGNAGLPSHQWPDPNGQRQANGAPPPAPTHLEGTPEHPGPAVIAGTPCSYTPAAGQLPDLGEPAAVRRRRPSVRSATTPTDPRTTWRRRTSLACRRTRPRRPRSRRAQCRVPRRVLADRARHRAAAVRTRPARGPHGSGHAGSVRSVHRTGIAAGRRHLAVAACARRSDTAAWTRPAGRSAVATPLPGNPPFLPPGSQG